MTKLETKFSNVETTIEGVQKDAAIHRTMLSELSETVVNLEAARKTPMAATHAASELCRFLILGFVLEMSDKFFFGVF